jgi:endoglucanase
MNFRIRRGTNISHWLSQSTRRGAEREAWFTQKDVAFIRSLGFDHIRLPVDEVQLWAEDGRQDDEAFRLLNAALDWCEDAGLRVIVDLHILRSHYFNDANVPALFTNPREAAKFVELWLELSHHLQFRDKEQVAYELLNEAVAANPDDWNRVANAAFSAVREVEPDRVIVLGSNWFNQAHTFDKLRVPDDRKTILTFHFYHPTLVTHHQAGWVRETGWYKGPVHYPGTPITQADLHQVIEPDKRAALEKENAAYDRAAMVRELAKPLAVSKRTGLPLYCGEFGCLSTVPQPTRLAWYRDLISVLAEHHIAWANWDYKGSFGIIMKDGQDTGILPALLGL